VAGHDGLGGSKWGLPRNWLRHVFIHRL
jgi:hypothetical protein